MGLLRMRMDALHYALLAVVVLLAVYCGASFFREVETASTNRRTPSVPHEQAKSSSNQFVSGKTLLKGEFAGEEEGEDS